MRCMKQRGITTVNCRTSVSPSSLEVENAVRFVRQHPESSPRIGYGLRKRVLYRFPYSVMYEVLPGLIMIYAVHHHKRRPFYWLDRMKT